MGCKCQNRSTSALPSCSLSKQEVSDGSVKFYCGGATSIASRRALIASAAAFGVLLAPKCPIDLFAQGRRKLVVFGTKYSRRADNGVCYRSVHVGKHDVRLQNVGIAVESTKGRCVATVDSALLLNLEPGEIHHERSGLLTVPGVFRYRELPAAKNACAIAHRSATRKRAQPRPCPGVCWNSLRQDKARRASCA